MNVIVNDKGETVRAVGSPNSTMRAAIEWPALIERLRDKFNAVVDSTIVHEYLKSNHDIQSNYERESIIECAGILVQKF